MLTVPNIQKAADRISDLVFKTPCQVNAYLSNKYNAEVFLKREDLQSVRSFKIRGAYNKISQLNQIDRDKGIICASAGNHAQGVAYACKHLKINAKVYMPSPTPQQKVKKVRLLGGKYIEIILNGDTFDAAYEEALKDAKINGAVFIHPFDDLQVIQGQATVGLEMLEQIPETLDYLFIAVGGGGLIAGVSSMYKQLSPTTKIVALEASGAASLYETIKKDEIVSLEKIDTFADGIAVKTIGKLSYELFKNNITDVVKIEEGHICSTILELYNEEAIVVEPAGAISVSALDKYQEEIRGKKVGLIICGGNNDITRTEEIKERALLYEGKKHYFIIRFPQRAGALKGFLNLLGPEDDITHFEYTKKTNRSLGPALVGIEFKETDDVNIFMNQLNSSQITFQHVNDMPILFEMLI